MNRRNITVSGEHDANTYIGWFDPDAADVLASYQSGGPYVDYVDILLTAGGKLVREDSCNHNGKSPTYTPCTAKTAVEFIVDDGTEAGKIWAAGKGAEAFAAAEIK